MTILRPSARLLLGDCRVLMADLEPDSVDAIVCDPPYGLSGEPDIVEVLTHWLAGDVYEHTSAGFMGKDWDSFVPGPDYWRECYRVLKPGGHLVAFSSTRTEDLLGIAIRLAGFTRRDLVSWLYYNGFPKGLNVGAEFDRMRDDRDDVLRVTEWIASARTEAGLTNADIDDHFGFSGMAGHWTTQRSQAATPRPAQWFALKELFGVPVPDEIEELVDRLNARKGTPGDDWSKREVIGTGSSGIATALVDEFHRGETTTFKITKAHSDLAREFEGFGTLLKPAQEPALLFQKPISEPSIALNVKRWRTGAINLDAARIRPGDPAWPGGADTEKETPHPLGYWPANVYHCKKPSVSEKEAGCDHLPTRSAAELVDREEGSAGMKNPRSGAGRTSKGRANFHTTVKPVGLMRWLCRLLTPPEGVVLDPFMGSGTTGVAAVSEGFDFIGCEKEKSYLPIAVARVDHAAVGLEVEAPEGTRVERVQTSLFGGS